MKRIQKFKKFTINEDFRNDPTSPFRHRDLGTDDNAKEYNDGIGDPNISNRPNPIRHEKPNVTPFSDRGKKIYPYYIDETPVYSDGTELDEYIEPGTRLVFDDVSQASKWIQGTDPIMIKSALDKPNGIAGGYIWSYSETL